MGWREGRKAFISLAVDKLVLWSDKKCCKGTAPWLVTKTTSPTKATPLGGCDALPMAGLGPEAEEEPREGGSLDLGGRECLACSIPNPAPRLPAAAAGEDDRAGKVRKRRNGGAAALSVTAGAGRRGRSELYLVLDAKAFLLATPDRCVFARGEM